MARISAPRMVPDSVMRVEPNLVPKTCTKPVALDMAVLLRLETKSGVRVALVSSVMILIASVGLLF